MGGNASGLFEIDGASGELFYSGSGEDFESGTNSFSLTVRGERREPARGHDRGRHRHRRGGSAGVRRAELRLHACREMRTGAPTGSRSARSAASDPEGATLAYSLVGGNASGLFEIDAASGELFYKGSGEDFESATNSFSLTVRASDGSLHADTTVAVTVTDVAEEESTQEAVVEQPQQDPGPEEDTVSVLDTADADLSDATSEAPTLTLGQSVAGEVHQLR